MAFTFLYFGLIIACCFSLFLFVYWSSGDLVRNAFAINDEHIFTPEDSPYNKTFGDWARDWWNWHLSIEDIRSKDNKSLFHPRENYSPAKCSLNQEGGPVWFLPDGKAVDDNTNAEIRECKVPTGKALLVQIIGSGCGMNEGFKNDEELLDCGIWALPNAELTAKIDGVEVINTDNREDRERLYVEPFYTNLSYVQNNIYNLSAGTYRGMVAGFYLFVPPLSEGTHEIEFKETAIKSIIDRRLSNVKYIITVE